MGDLCVKREDCGRKKRRGKGRGVGGDAYLESGRAKRSVPMSGLEEKRRKGEGRQKRGSSRGGRLTTGRGQKRIHHSMAGEK